MNRYRIKKCVLTAIFVLCISIMIGVTDANAQTGTGVIQGTNINVRSDAGTEASKVTSLSQGDAVIVTGSKKDTAGNVWYAVTFNKNGKEYKGYIISNYVNYKESPVSSDSQTKNESSSTGGNVSAKQEKNTSSGKWKGKINAANVNVRQAAVTGNVVGKVSTGTAVTVSKSKTGPDGKTWYYISYKENGSTKKGWIRHDFVNKDAVLDASDSTGKEQMSTVEGETTVIDVSGFIKEEQKNTTSKTKENKKKEKTGNIKGDYVRIRKKPVTGAVICQLMSGAELVVESEKEGSDGMKWYKVSFTYNGAKKTGFVRSDFVVVKEIAESEKEQENVETSADFEEELKKQGFPDSYKDALRSLHNSHPEWEFRAVATGLEWNDVIVAESKVGTNLVSKNAITSWKSTEKAAYNWKTDTWYTFDGGAWVSASKEIISYYMDPRNFLTETAIFQFESLEYEEYQNKEGVQRLLAGSFMKGNYKEPDGTKRNYAETFVEIGKQVGVSPYHLAARCYQEQGKGTSGSVSGKVEGFENIFNYYNIGAYASGNNSPVVQGLRYAANQSINPESNYDRPWNTRYKSLLGGSKYVAEKYVKVKQNTLYFQKFNVVNKTNGIYRHQYMTNLQAAESEAMKMSKAYTQTDTKLVFYIPVYKNMPKKACVKPESNANPNNYLATLEVEGQKLTPVFDPTIESYDLTVEKKVKKVQINATAVVGTSTVTGTGKVALERGENVVKITCKAQSGAERVYTIHIIRK